MTRPSAKRYLHHCSFRRENNQRAVDKAYHSFEESLLSSQLLSVGRVRTGRLVNEFGSPGSSSSREMENETTEELQKSHVLKVEELHSSRSRVSRQSTTSGTTTRSTQILRLTTSTPGIRWLHHCTFWSEKQVRDCRRFIFRKEKPCLNVHSQFSVSTGRPAIWMSQKRKSNQELDK